MKKVLFILFLSLVSVYAKEDSGFFIGADIGGNAASSTSVSNGINGVITTSSSGSFGISGKVGYKYFLNDNFGIRGYAMIGYAESASIPTTTNDLSQILYTLNVDVLYNFYNGDILSVGIFGGFGSGGIYQSLLNTTISNSSAFTYSDMKLGLRVSIAKNHSIEFTYIPSSYVGSATSTNSRLYSTYLSYNFTF